MVLFRCNSSTVERLFELASVLVIQDMQKLYYVVEYIFVSFGLCISFLLVFVVKIVLDMIIKTDTIFFDKIFILIYSHAG